MNKKWLILIVLLLLLTIGGFGWYYFKRHAQEDVIKASGTIQTTEVQIGSLVGGRIVTVQAKEGDDVKPGQTLVTLDPYQIPQQKAALKAQLEQAQAQLQEQLNGPRPQEIAEAKAQYRSAREQASLQRAGARTEEIAQARADLEETQTTFRNDEANYHRFEQLYKRHVVSLQEFEDVRTTYQASLQRVSAAKQKLLELEHGNRPQEIAAADQDAKARLAQLQLLQAGTRPEEIAQQRAQIGNLRAQLAQLNDAAAETRIKASCDCQINSMDWKPGQLIAPNQTVATLYNLNDLWIRVYVPDERFGQMNVGDAVTMKVDAFPDKTFTGTVIQLASRAEFTPRNIQTEEGRRIQVFGVKVNLHDPNHLLRPGMPADVFFEVKPKRQEGRG